VTRLDKLLWGCVVGILVLMQLASFLLGPPK
jgi:hypothetical protein